MTEASPRAALRVQAGPANYWCHAGALGQLAQLYSEEELRHAVCIAGARARLAALPYMPQTLQASTRHEVFAGHCTHSQVDALAARHGATASLVIGIGGGSALDTAKALSAKLDKPFIAIPTIAATCAAFTPLAVWYDDDGHALGYEIFKRGAEAVLVEPRIILEAPPEYLQAGLADTLAKWYEASILCSQESVLPFMAKLGLETAQSLRDLLLSKGESAFEAMKQGIITHDFVSVIDAIIAGGGLVGGLGERYTRIAAAHAIHNGLSVLPESARHLHGHKVAYGLLVQCALQENFEAMKELSEFFRSLGLPTSLGGLGIDIEDQEKIDRFIQATLAPHESIHLLPFTVDACLLQKAICSVEYGKYAYFL